MRCPGQDTRYWKEDAVFDMPCPKCGVDVELFKDESSVRCRRCGHRFENPKVALGCAQWCPHAEQCVGVTPAAKTTGSSEGGFASRLIEAVKERLAGQPSRLARALMVFQHAKALVSREAGDARDVLAAAVLLETLPEDSKAAPDPAAAIRPAREVLEQAGFDEEAVARVCRLLSMSLSGGELEGVEARLVNDARQLAQLACEQGSANGRPIEEVVAERLRTETARQRALSLFQASG